MATARGFLHLWRCGVVAFEVVTFTASKALPPKWKAEKGQNGKMMSCMNNHCSCHDFSKIICCANQPAAV